MVNWAKWNRKAAFTAYSLLSRDAACAIEPIHAYKYQKEKDNSDTAYGAPYRRGSAPGRGSNADETCLSLCPESPDQLCPEITTVLLDRILDMLLCAWIIESLVEDVIDACREVEVAGQSPAQQAQRLRRYRDLRLVASRWLACWSTGSPRSRIACVQGAAHSR